MRRFEFVEGGSRKFWEVDLLGAALTVRFGRMGADGQSKTTTFPSADEATAEMAKLVREKTKKGYQEIGAASDAPVVKALRRPTAYSTGEHYAVVDFDPEEGGLKDIERKVYAVRTDYDAGEDGFNERIEALLADPKVGQLKALVIGNWFGDDSSGSPTELIAKLIAAKDRLTSLIGIFLGDVIQEENEISWITQTSVTDLLHAFPKLEEFVVRGGNELRMSGLKHDSLRTLIVQSGGLSTACVKDLAASRLPVLERVALWLGTDQYGGDYSIADLGPILRGEVWPKLEYLGLMNAEGADAIAQALVSAPILTRIRALDLSMGALTDAGGLALLGCQQLRSLSFLNLRRHYLSDAVMAQFKKIGIEVDVSDQESSGDEDDEEYRSCEVTE